MPFDIKAAREAGYDDKEIAGFLEKQHSNFDVKGAMKAGYSLEEISGRLEKPKPSVEPSKAPGLESTISQMQPSNVLPAVGLATKAVGQGTGLDITNPISPVADTGTVLKAAMHPIDSLKNTAEGLKRAVGIATNPDFKPTTEEAPIAKVGKWGGIALETVGQPSTGPAKGGLIDKASESVDSLAGVPRGSSFALLKQPSKWFKIFQSKAGVKAAYKAAVEAGEQVAEDVGEKSVSELAGTATSGVTKTVKELAEEVGPMIEGGAKPIPNKLITFRKAINDEIGRLKTAVEKAVLSEKAHNTGVRKLVHYQELARRTNGVLDTVAPRFREADKLMTVQKEMAPFRAGIKPLVMGTGTAAVGLGLQQGNRAMSLGNELSNALQDLARKRKRKGN